MKWGFDPVGVLLKQMCCFSLLKQPCCSAARVLGGSTPAVLEHVLTSARSRFWQAEMDRFDKFLLTIARTMVRFCASHTVLTYFTTPNAALSGGPASRRQPLVTQFSNGRQLRVLQVRSTELGALLNAGQATIFGGGLLAAMLIAAKGYSTGALSLGDVVAVNGLLLQLSRPMDFIGYTVSQLALEP